MVGCRATQSDWVVRGSHGSPPPECAGLGADFFAVVLVCAGSAHP